MALFDYLFIFFFYPLECGVLPSLYYFDALPPHLLALLVISFGYFC